MVLETVGASLPPLAVAQCRVDIKQVGACSHPDLLVSVAEWRNVKEKRVYSLVLGGFDLYRGPTFGTEKWHCHLSLCLRTA